MNLVVTDIGEALRASAQVACTDFMLTAHEAGLGLSNTSDIRALERLTTAAFCTDAVLTDAVALLSTAPDWYDLALERALYLRQLSNGVQFDPLPTDDDKRAAARYEPFSWQMMIDSLNARKQKAAQLYGALYSVLQTLRSDSLALVAGRAALKAIEAQVSF